MSGGESSGSEATPVNNAARLAITAATRLAHVCVTCSHASQKLKSARWRRNGLKKGTRGGRWSRSLEKERRDV